MRLVIAAQGGVAGVGEKKLQRRRFNVAVAKDYVGLLALNQTIVAKKFSDFFAAIGIKAKHRAHENMIDACYCLNFCRTQRPR
jgi:hypothetical protein